MKSARGQTQTPGQIIKFDPDLNVVDSVITQDPSGNIGIRTTTPAAALDVSGDLNLAGYVLKNHLPFIHNFGSTNTFIGVQAGNLSMTGFSNTGIGVWALSNIGGGSNNTATGISALFSNTVGCCNTATGQDALFSNTTGFENTASGLNALRSNTTGFLNTANGYAALDVNTTGTSNTATGFWALHSNDTGTNNTAIGVLADVSDGDLTNATAIGFTARVDASNKIRLGNTDVSVIEGQVPYTFTSDKSQKENFQPVESDEVLTKIAGLSLTSWNYIGHNPHKLRHYGPVAQEFFEAFGHDSVGTIGTPTTINSGDMEGILMIAVQALEKRTAEIAELKTRIELLERAINDMQAVAIQASEHRAAVR
jgi:hypothetical protein